MALAGISLVAMAAQKAVSVFYGEVLKCFASASLARLSRSSKAATQRLKEREDKESIPLLLEDDSSSLLPIHGEETQAGSEPYFRFRQELAKLTAHPSLPYLLVASLYVAQNNAYLMASSKLTPTILQAVWQMRIIATAIAASLITNRQFTKSQKFSLALLVSSVLVIKLSLANSISSAAQQETSESSGVLYAILACTISGVAGVLLETALQRKEACLWTANTEMSLFSIFPALVLMIIRGLQDKSFDHFSLSGHSRESWGLALIINHGVAGMLVALVTKHAGSVAKIFSGAFSLALTFCVAVAIGIRPLPPSLTLMVTFFGVLGLVISSWLYTSPRAKT